MSSHVGDKAVAYWSGELDAAARIRIDTHLSSCAACRDAFEDVRVALGAVSAWSPAPQLGQSIEDRIVATLPKPVTYEWAGKPVGTLPAWFSRAAAAIVLAAVCGAAGFFAGRASHSTPSSTIAVAADSALHSYLFLLEERVWPPPAPLARTGYGEWARSLATDARFVGAEKLTEEPGFRIEPDGRVERPTSATRPPNVSGWYVIRARSYVDAIDWARRGPHLSFGSILVREIEDTPRTTVR